MYEHRQSSEHSFKEFSKKGGSTRIEEANRDYPAPSKNQFKLSTNAPKFGDSASLLQLQRINKLAQLQVDNRLTAIFDIVEIKILTKLDLGFTLVKQAEDPYLAAYSHQKSVQSMGNSFFGKLDNVYRMHLAKNLVFFLIHLKIQTLRSRSENSKREMLRINSRVERDHDDFQPLDKNASKQQGVNSTQKTNKLLRKKKEQSEKEFNSFKTQMELLLSHHENLLARKN